MRYLRPIFFPSGFPFGPNGMRWIGRDADDQDGGEELDDHSKEESIAGWVWKFNKSPMGRFELWELGVKLMSTRLW